LIRKLLTPDVNKRLKAPEVKAHHWFNNVPWSTVSQKAMRPPIIPNFLDEADTANFDTFPEVPIPESDEDVHSAYFDQF
jgi:hypothetical protein